MRFSLLIDVPVFCRHPIGMSTPADTFPALPQAHAAEATAAAACAALEKKEEDIQRLRRLESDARASLTKLKRRRDHVAEHSGEFNAVQILIRFAH